MPVSAIRCPPSTTAGVSDAPGSAAPALGLGGWQSTISYYRYLNEETNTRLGTNHTADLRIWSGDFAPIAECTAVATENSSFGNVKSLFR